MPTISSSTQPTGTSSVNSPIIVALDYPTAHDALAMAQRIDPTSARLKIGKQLFVAEGPHIVEQLQKLGFELFLDLKFHDIPNTVAQACLSAAKLGVWMTNVHALGGSPMLRAVYNALSELPQRPLVTAVTVLTSMDQPTFDALGFNKTIEQAVFDLATLTQQSGLDGVVCSAHEAPALRARLGDDFILVTPGIRLASDNTDDQHRIMTPQAALAAGADYLVIGRPITQSKDPDKTISSLRQQLT